jgi:hypothetical protein
MRCLLLRLCGHLSPSRLINGDAFHIDPPAPKPAVEAAADDPTVSLRRSPARYLWAMLLALIYETLHLTNPG